MKVKTIILKKVSHFNYIGSILTNNSNIQVEIDTRFKMVITTTIV